MSNLQNLKEQSSQSKNTYEILTRDNMIIHSYLNRV
ncbi:unnamed protein product [Paramecium octaurelia]|uniref:Uncharacterized protein n=1 Tax=Paramecium octaurelia TaxID=43137 RepID=A0A8S1V2I9_PAROT|nr:unnamed protein product [Paramecium octaurelia]